MWDKEVQDARPELRADQWARMAGSGVETARVIFSWNLAQPQAGSPPDFARTDVMVELASRHGIDLLPVVTHAPPWARVEPEKDGSAPSDVHGYADYVTALIRRYGPRGSYWRLHPDVPKRPIRAWQIWNEPALEWQFSPSDSRWPMRYGRVLRAASRAVKKADPGATVVLAGLVNVAWVDLGVLYAKGGIRGHFDVAAVHIYSGKPSDFVDIVRRFRRVIRRNGGGGLPIYVTEAGASASADDFRSPGHEHFQLTDAEMARHIPATYRALAAARRRLGIERVYWYTWATAYTRESGIFGYSGLNSYDGFEVEPMPALAAYRRMAASYEGCRKDATARCVR
jgi:hypothetical protein